MTDILQYGPKLASGCCLAAIVLTSAVIDARKMILPNWLNALLAVTGLLQAILVGRPELIDALVGSVLGVAVLGSIAITFRAIRGVEGLGMGDLKFVAAAGLWIGWQDVAIMLVIASFSGLIFVTLRAIRNRELSWSGRLPFGPFLALATLMTWVGAGVSG